MNKLKKQQSVASSAQPLSGSSRHPSSPTTTAIYNGNQNAYTYRSGSTATTQPSIPSSSAIVMDLVPSKNIAEVWNAASSPASMKPRTYVEQYWAARALTAETMLTARASHQRELASLKFSEESKRSREIALLVRAHETRQDKLEKCVVALIACIMILAGLVTYMMMKSASHVSASASWWPSPSHFTIPILSPFTNVVEQETSVVGSKTVATIVVVLGGLAYAIFRHWFGQR
ncbi:hypothetical protein SERLA73DRAFT_179176 [Serpula lacrymans var. lacrymans S7.3]|uniref:Uncharacterized protein n=2 Tax=Serpula lacrymans var. lacrymans TaxID=341189 RepID=F8PRI3_SERL3|nr:uncharacterized protein SERLADRAFT_464176 [Serpula lacrymans var. lacrymans S7.9]EGO01122.1 hypothetical protein SERLA73DRAFT_179176 [Serpula lacrymans var. lacrymans S7.3]EGO26775.1 hypothetical protein SERLADRAFT_464176 [Serpula lacrymans var. lacrymans S7.9]